MYVDTLKLFFQPSVFRIFFRLKKEYLSVVTEVFQCPLSTISWEAYRLMMIEKGTVN
jgi:hypothetical protein